MITLENKLNFIEGNIFLSSPNLVLQARFICYALIDKKDDFVLVNKEIINSINLLNDEIISKKKAIQITYWDRLSTKTKMLCVVSPYKMIFDGEYLYEKEIGQNKKYFDELSEDLKSEIKEYCEWIVSKDGIDFAKKIAKLQSFK